MIFPTLRVKRSELGASDVYGQPLPGREVGEMVTPVKLSLKSQHTTVRTDSAASHGHAYETTADVVLLFLPNSKVAIGDFVTVLGTKTVVMAEHPRFQTNGKKDHIEVHCLIWK